MIRHFFIDKSATIIKEEKTNTGLNPILSLNYGEKVSRILLHFNEDEIKSWISDNSITDYSKLSFILRVTNCFSVDGVPYNKEIVSAPGGLAERASSFDLQSFKLQQMFDAGRGYDYKSDMWIGEHKAYSENGANWTYSNGKTKWKSTGAYSSQNDICKQHFDFGNENISMDITSYVTSILDGEDNFGIGIKYVDEEEIVSATTQQYVGFFSNNTNTYFHPYVEAIYNDYIDDDREHFIFGKNNKLYLYVNFGGNATNLDSVPTCTIDGTKFTVKQAMKGVYYANVLLTSKSGKEELKHDIWSNLLLEGVTIDDVIMDFTAKPLANTLSIGNGRDGAKSDYIPSISGIDDNEELTIGEVRNVDVDFREKYTTGRKSISHKAEYRIYVKDGRRDITVFDYQPIEHSFVKNFFTLNTNDLIPNTYYVDIRMTDSFSTKYHHEVLRFKVKSNVTERYW